jgi:hypothetical protein
VNWRFSWQFLHFLLTILIFSLLCPLISITCREKAGDIAHSGIIVYKKDPVEILDHKKNTRKPEIKTRVFEKEKIKTGPNGQINIQIRALGVIQVLEKSEIQMDYLLNLQKGTGLRLKKGVIFSKIKRKLKTKKFKIATPVSVAAVRGTEFAVQFINNETTILVKEGEIAVNKLDEPDKLVLLEKGEKTTVTPKGVGKTEVLKKSEELILNKYSIWPIIKNPEEISEKELKQISQNISIKEEKLQEEINKELENEKFMDELMKLPPLDRLRKIGKVLTKFYLKDGSQIIGNIISQKNKIIKLNTGSQIIKIPKSDVIKRQSVK